LSEYIKNTERSPANNLMQHLKVLEKQKYVKPKTSKRREIIKLSTKFIHIVTKKKKKKQRINETKS
jgi:CTP-dependent riboflavin kinase